MMLNALQKQQVQLRQQTRENRRQAGQIQDLIEQSKLQAAQNRRLFAEVVRLKGMFEQAMAPRSGARNLAAAFTR
jgi:hypothetical protein